MSIQETISIKRGRISLLHKVLCRTYIILQKIYRFLIVSKVKLFYPYNNILYLHPFFRRYYKRPVVPYCNLSEAKLCHYVNALSDSKSDIPYVIEPNDHPLAAVGKSEPHEVIRGIEIALNTYSDVNCRKILLEGEGQQELFKYYFPSELLHKIEIIRLGAIAQPVDFEKKFTNIETPVFLCLASDYKRKAVDLLIKAWSEFSLKSKCKLIIVCHNIPHDIKCMFSALNIDLVESSPLSKKDKKNLIDISHVMITPWHVDGGAISIEAYENGLPIISMRSQRSFIRDGNGWEVDVPFYFYDDGYGKEWRTWDSFWKILDDAKKDKAFDITIQGFVNVFEEIAKSPEILLSMGRSSYDLACGEFSLERRNEKLRKIYRECLQ